MREAPVSVCGGFLRVGCVGFPMAHDRGPSSAGKCRAPLRVSKCATWVIPEQMQVSEVIIQGCFQRGSWQCQEKVPRIV
jgi:hypothetical protein